MKKYSLIIAFFTLLLSCSKKNNGDIGDYAMEKQSINLVKGGSSLTIDAGSLANGNTIACTDFSSIIAFYNDTAQNYYVVHHEYGFKLQSNASQLLKPAHFKIHYIKCTSTSVPCLIYHNDLKPYKIKITASTNLSSSNQTELIPVLNYSIDSTNQIISFDESELNSLYVVCRKN